MAFRMIVKSVGADSELNFDDDSEKAQAIQLAVGFHAGVKPMDDTLTVHHAHGVFRRRWADIKDLRIEEV